MGECGNCKNWLIRQETRYGNGEVIVKWKADEGKGKCEVLSIQTPPEFGCNKYKNGGPLIKSRFKTGEPWHYSVGGPCPDCKHPYCGYPDCKYPHCPGMDKCLGRGSLTGSHDDRCVGTGMVSYYEDGYIGNNKTRKHPKELAGFTKPGTVTPSCYNCKFEVNENWNICPNCGKRLKEEASDMEFVSDNSANMGAP